MNTQTKLASTRFDLPEIHPFVGADVWSMLNESAAAVPDKELLTWQPFDAEPVVWTYATFLAECREIAAGLQARGIQAGDRVVIHMENCPEFLLAWFACAAIHAVAVTTNSRSSVDELAYYIDNSGARAAITQAQFAGLVREAAPGLEWVSVVPHAGETDTTAVATEESFAALHGDPAQLVLPEPDPAAWLCIQYTSGTTSRPKGVLWTQANGLWSARVNALHEGLLASDVHLVYLPLFHTNAMGYSVLASIWARARFVLTPKWSTSRFWDISVAHGCTWLSLVGLSSRAIMDSTPPENHSYRAFGSGASNPILEEKCGVESVNWWGMTETVSHGIISDGRATKLPGSIGRAAPEYEIAVRRPDGTSVVPGETGDLYVRGIRGVSLFAEYWNNPEATAEIFDAEGWMATGDLVRLNDDGSFTFMDRAKDMLKIGAENVAASEIERVIQQVVGTAEIAVVGRPDDSLDEVPVVFVVDPSPAEGLADHIIDACRKQLADFKVPRAVHFVRVLPHSTLNKVNKVELRRLLAEGASLSEAQDRWEIADKSDPSGDALPG
ncbi:ATP-dependent acyl-CoA ligase [Enteractinococcus fodinae]|uniref:Crotonobetaine/carnitine-CoA ligase n=1 Tax=Enteractinococcus fodinae TaxID=684663 RepID=A0ABU2B425_9MICC|nr:AMP-binding protein [Enteractinococcus fodinae]MDR7348362.1 crotonobetaine/carnitine-CoA ligase [Enteractinococcus fodinae]